MKEQEPHRHQRIGRASRTSWLLGHDHEIVGESIVDHETHSHTFADEKDHGGWSPLTGESVNYVEWEWGER